MAGKLTAEWKPEWQTRVGRVAETLAAESDDSLVSARRVRQPIESKDDINNAFDGITYLKGAAVIAMFENWLGPGEFQKGIQAYMKRYAFKATTSAEFLDAVSAAAHKDVSKPFSTFLDQAGVPIISVRLTCDRRASPVLHVEQRRFLPLGSKGSGDQIWQIPLCVRHGSADTGQRECTLLTQPASDWKLNAKNCPTWVEANDNAVGYYRVDYQGGLLQALTQGSTANRLTAPERVDFIGNAQALSSAGKLPAADALALVSIFRADSERHVVQAAVDLALAPHAQLVPDDLMPHYARFLRENFQARARELGWVATPGESDDIRLVRPPLVRAVATWGGDNEFARQSTELTEKWFQNRQSVDPNMLGAILGTNAFYGDTTLFHRFLTTFTNTQDKQLREQLIAAMSSFRDPAAIEAGMDALIAGDVPFIEGAFLLFTGQDQASTRKLPFEFVKAHFDQIVTKMPSGGTFDFGAFLPHVGDAFCDEASRSELQAFFQPKVQMFTGAPRTLSQVLERIDLCIASKAAQQPSVASFLNKYLPSR
jgi:alanyl aminopeptidase